MRTKLPVVGALCVITAIFIASCAKSPVEPLSSEKALTSFSFASPVAIGIINDSAKTITIQVPRGTDASALVATFNTTGEKVEVGSAVQTSGATANNFTNPVVYKVTAADKSTASYTVTVVFQKHCLFFSAITDPGDPRDSVLIEKLRSWGYVVTIAASTTIPGMTTDTFAQYDFAFLSETPNSSDYARLKGHPLPLLNLEAWAAAKSDVLNWSTVRNASGSAAVNFDSLPLVIANTANGSLTGGMSAGTEFKLVNGTSVVDQAEIGFIPTIAVIPIATFKDPSLIDTLWNGQDSSVLTISGGLVTAACAVDSGIVLADGTTITQKRAVTIGMHANAYGYITEEAYKLMKAGISWIMKE